MGHNYILEHIICKFRRHISFFLPWLHLGRIVRDDSYYTEFALLVEEKFRIWNKRFDNKDTFYRIMS